MTAQGHPLDNWRRNRLGEESLYCSAHEKDDEVLCYGSDNDLNETEKVARRLRYEEQGLRYLRGQIPLLLSASLRGPFDKASGWQNPWLGNRQCKRRNLQQNTLLSRQQTPAMGPLKSISDRDPEQPSAQDSPTPATRDSMDCHLPSPDSHRDLNLTSSDLGDAENFSWIRQWADGVPAGALEKDHLFAPDLSDTNNKKRPAGKGWLRRAFDKRMKMNYTPSTSSIPTPTFAPEPAVKNIPVPKAVVQTQSSPIRSRPSNRSFEMTTPSSSPEKGSLKAAKMRSFVSSAKNDTVFSGDGSVEIDSIARDGLSRQISFGQIERNSSLRIPQGSVPKESSDLSSMSSAQFEEEEDEADISFESHLDNSFQYKARPTKQEGPPAIAPAQHITIDPLSQPTQTGTPESENHGESVAFKADAEISQHVPSDIEASEQENVFSKQGSLDAQCDENKPELEDTMTLPYHEVIGECDGTEDLPSASSNADMQRLSKTKSLDTTICASECQSPEQTSAERVRQFETFEAVKASMNQVESTAMQNTQVPQELEIVKKGFLVHSTANGQSSPEAMIDEETTLIDDPMDVDGNPFFVPQPHNRLEIINFPLDSHGLDTDMRQPPEQLETIKFPLDNHGLGVDMPQPPERVVSIKSLLNEPDSDSNMAQASEKLVSIKFLLNDHDPDANIPRAPQRLETIKYASNSHRLNSMHFATAKPPSQNDPRVVHLITSSPADLEADIEDDPKSPAIKIEAAGEDEGERNSQSQEAGPQSPWVAEDSLYLRHVKSDVEGNEREETCSAPIGAISSPSLDEEQHSIRPSQQSPWVSIDVGPVNNIVPNPFIEDRITSTSQANKATSQAAEDQENAWADMTAGAPFSSNEDLSRPVTAQCPRIMSQTPIAVVEGSPAPQPRQLSTPSMHVDGESTPADLTMSIKSFAELRRGSLAHQRRRTKHTRLSGGSLSSSQGLPSAMKSNPWSSTRPKSSRRVSFAPFPGEEDDNALTRSSAVRAASPPPYTTVTATDEDVDQTCLRHLDTLKNRGDTTPKFRIQPRLLPSSSQQMPMSPAINAMAEAFREADAHQVSRPHTPSINGEIAEDEDDMDDTPQSPWQSDNTSESHDAVAHVLQNLDAFLNPQWDIEPKGPKAGAAEGIENQLPEADMGTSLSGTNIWDDIV